MAYDPHNNHTITNGLANHIIVNTDLPPWYKIKENPTYNTTDNKGALDPTTAKPIADIHYCGLANNIDVHIATIALSNDHITLHGNYYIGYKLVIADILTGSENFFSDGLVFGAKPIHLGDPEFTKTLPKEINNLHWDMYNHYPEFHKIKTYGKPPKPRI